MTVFSDAVSKNSISPGRVSAGTMPRKPPEMFPTVLQMSTSLGLTFADYAIRRSSTPSRGSETRGYHRFVSLFVVPFWIEVIEESILNSEQILEHHQPWNIIRNTTSGVPLM
jgi:hypothetical protein